MAKRRCAACGCLFAPRSNVPHQRFCSAWACQCARRRRWQRDKLKNDADYRANQAAARLRWREGHPEYWHDYRQRHPDTTERNRERQRERNRRRRAAGADRPPPVLAEMDEYSTEKAVVSGTYRMIPVAVPGIAKVDAYTVEIRLISTA